MVLYMVGLGLYDHKDITLRGLEVIKKSKRVFLEAYTSILLVGTEELESLYGVNVEIADREMVESKSDLILSEARENDVSFCVVGDPFGATTHTDLMLRASEAQIEVVVIHNASIMNAVAGCGLQLYRFGQTVSVVFFTDTWKPQSFYDKIAENKRQKLHTLCLLDIKVKEPTMESLARGRPVYESPRYMSIATCIDQLLEIEDVRQEGVTDANCMCVGVARMGAVDFDSNHSQLIVSGKMKDLRDVDFGKPLHSLVICGELDSVEEQMIKLFSVTSVQKNQTPMVN